MSHCPVTACTLKEPGCATALALQPDVTLGASPFGITASETNPLGYSVTFCFECEVIPTGQAPLYFTRDSFIVSQLAVDCSASLVDNGFLNPPAIPFNAFGSTLAITTGFTDLFTHDIQVSHCPVTACTLKEPGCATALSPQPDVTLGASPFGITASETNPLGYSVTFCFECEVIPTGQAPLYFTRDSLVVSQQAVNCSSAL